MCVTVIFRRARLRDTTELEQRPLHVFIMYLHREESAAISFFLQEWTRVSMSAGGVRQV